MVDTEMAFCLFGRLFWHTVWNIIHLFLMVESFISESGYIGINWKTSHLNCQQMSAPPIFFCMCILLILPMFTVICPNEMIYFCVQMTYTVIYFCEYLSLFRHISRYHKSMCPQKQYLKIVVLWKLWVFGTFSLSNDFFINFLFYKNCLCIKNKNKRIIATKRDFQYFESYQD